MIVLRGFDESPAGRGGYLSIGNFDGVHRGHQAILGTLVARARQAGAPAVVMTFDPHPIQLLAPERAPPVLTTLARKTELIAACGVDVLIIVPTALDLLALTADEFFERIICGRLSARGLVEGPNFCFGRDRAGDVSRLQQLCHAAGRELAIVEPVNLDSRIVSSSTIRRAVSEGRMADAVAMLGNPYQVEGQVAPGARRGRDLGFPTANLTGATTLLPRDGVYAGITRLGDQSFASAIHVGPNPTFGEAERKFEVHIIDFDGDLYGRNLRVDLLARIRDTESFGGLDALRQQLQRDVARARDLVAASAWGKDVRA